MPATSAHAAPSSSVYAVAVRGEKRSLASILRETGPLGVTEAVDIILDVCDELANAHMNGVVHGDLGAHRVRTVWPRLPGCGVDIFALGEMDTAANEFRASARAFLAAPEQRHGGAIDGRADIFAVGVLLHLLITGVAPAPYTIRQTLAGFPRPIAQTIEACLAEDPAWRPASIDDVAEALGSFSFCPPERFAQIASRRLSGQATRTYHKDLRDVDHTLSRLDDAALSRELSAATAAPPPSSGMETLVMVSVQSVFSKAPQPPSPQEPRARRHSTGYPAALPPPPDSEAVETLPSHAIARQEFRAAPAVAHLGRSDELPAAHPGDGYLSPPVDRFTPVPWADEDARQRVHSVPPISFEAPPPRVAPKRSVWGSMFGFVAVAAVAAASVLVVARISEQSTVRRAQAAVEPAPPPPTSSVSAPSAPTQVSAPKASSSPDAQPAAAAAAPGKPTRIEPPVATASSLPDARPPKARGAVRAKTPTPTPTPRPAAREDGVPASREPSHGARTTAPASREEGEEFTVTSSALSDALR